MSEINDIFIAAQQALYIIGGVVIAGTILLAVKAVSLLSK